MFDTYEPFNFGTRLGPLGKPDSAPVQGRIIRRKTYYGGGTSPLQGGHYIEWTGLGPPDEGLGGPWLPRDPGGTGVIGRDEYDIILETPVSKKDPYDPFQWGKCALPNGKKQDCCPEESKILIRDAYKKLLTLPCLASNIFPGLLRDLTNAYKKIVRIQCQSSDICTLPDGTVYYSRYRETGELVLCGDVLDTAATKPDPPNPDDYNFNFLVAKLLHELIHAAGGNEIDAVSIVKACFPTRIFDLLSEYHREIQAYCIQQLLNNGPKVIFGKYTAWSPTTGEVFLIRPPGSRNVQDVGPVVFARRDPEWRRDPEYVNKLPGGPC